MSGKCQGILNRLKCGNPGQVQPGGQVKGQSSRGGGSGQRSIQPGGVRSKVNPAGGQGQVQLGGSGQRSIQPGGVGQVQLAGGVRSSWLGGGSGPASGGGGGSASCALLRAVCLLRSRRRTVLFMGLFHDRLNSLFASCSYDLYD